MKRIIICWMTVMGWWLGLAGPALAATTEHSLTIERRTVDITGRAVDKITVNGSIPGPILRFTEGDEAVIRVTNRMDEDSSIHWHGILLPEGMDGVPGLGGFPGIKPGETFTYRFRVRQNGTYWYHAHSLTQEQDGLYGALVIRPRTEDPVRDDRDLVVLLSDFSAEDGERILANLKKSSDYYQYSRRTIGDFLSDVRIKGLGEAWKESSQWGAMRMLPTDLSDVSGYSFLVNGRTPDQNWTGEFHPGEKVRLRFINASAMTFFDVRIPGLEMLVVAADGQDVEPFPVDEFRIGVAETYDVVVTPVEDKAHAIVAEPIDRTGFALATLAPRQGMRGERPQQRPRARLTMADMGMVHGGQGMAHMDHADPGKDNAGHGAMDHVASMDEAARPAAGVPGSGWAETGAPAGARVLAYTDLRRLGTQLDTRPPSREVEIRLGGNMERYMWTMNGRKFSEAGPISLKYGGRVRLTLVNETMMAHPMHLHGMFVQLENGQPAGKLPNKHTVIVAPGETLSVLLTADEPGEWAYHCHLLYHMMTGMMSAVTVSRVDPSPESQITPTMHQDMDHGAGPMGHDGRGVQTPPEAGVHGGHGGTHGH